MIRFIPFLILFSFARISLSQDLISGSKTWGSLGINKDIGKKWTLGFENLQCFNTVGLSFSFNQSTLELQRKLKFNSAISLDYAYSIYKWRSSYERFGLQPQFGNAIIHRIGFNIENRFKISKKIKVKQTLQSQLFIPTLDKYQFRFSYRLKISYSNSNWIWKLSPFIEPMIYFYLNGHPVIYRNNNNKIETYKSPNGFHRFRIKSGFSLKPFRKLKDLSLTIYYMYQQEFNINGLGNDLNVIGNGSSTLTYPFTPDLTNLINHFNNYSVYGFHIHYDLD